MKKTALAVTLLLMLTLFMAINVSAGPAMDRIMEKGELFVGISGAQPPMTAITQKGEIVGLDADIAGAMASCKRYTRSGCPEASGLMSCPIIGRQRRVERSFTWR